MKEMKVEHVIISKQFEYSDNYKNFIKIVEDKKIKVYLVECGNRIQLEKNTYIDFIWPDNTNQIIENRLNNNSIVCKLNYYSFSVLFTGDIETPAEKQIIQKYNNNILNSTVLKVAHHGSITSSTQDFINLVKPKYALIGVGKDNKFGHPNVEILERLTNNGTKVYRTDEMGEIILKVNKKGKIKIETFIK